MWIVLAGLPGQVEWQNDTVKRDVEVKESETIDIVDSDERSCKNVQVQVKGNEEGIRVGDVLHVQQGETVKIVNEDEESCGNASDGQVIGIGEGRRGGEGFHINKTGRADRGDSEDDDERNKNSSDGQMADGEDVHDCERGGAELADYDFDDENDDGQVISDGAHKHKRGKAERGDHRVVHESNDKAKDGKVIGDEEISGEIDAVHCLKNSGEVLKQHKFLPSLSVRVACLRSKDDIRF